MAKLKTQANDKSVKDFLNAIEKEQKRKDSWAILEIIKEVTGEVPQMWGDSIIGFGQQHLVYESGRELDWFKVGFSPRKQNISLYLLSNHEDYKDLFAQLGKYKTGKSCLYINKLKDVEEAILRQIIEVGYKQSDSTC